MTPLRLVEWALAVGVAAFVVTAAVAMVMAITQMAGKRPERHR